MRAEAVETAPELLARARREYGLADFETALETLERARPLARRGQELGQVLALRAVVIGELRGLEQARPAFAEALREDEAVCPERGSVKGNLVALCEEIRREGRATFVLEGAGRGREVFLDGKPGCTVPCQLTVPLGAHQLELRGKQPVRVWTGRVALDGRVVLSVPAEVIERPRVAAAPSAPPVRPRARRLWTWVAAGAVAGFGLASLGCWLGAEREYSSWEELVAGPSTPQVEDRIASLESSTRRLEIASWTLLAAAGAAAIVGGVLFWHEGRREAGPPSRVTARPLGSGALVGVSF